jgi:hypothetical protein
MMPCRAAPLGLLTNRQGSGHENARLSHDHHFFCAFRELGIIPTDSFQNRLHADKVDVRVIDFVDEGRTAKDVG